MKKVTQKNVLDAQDVKLLARLFLAQLVRTPSWYIRHKNHLAKQTESMGQGILERIGRERPQLNVRPNVPVNIDADEGFPLRMRVELVGDKYRMNLMTAAGRKLWMWSIRHLLREDGPLLKLQSLQWSILQAPPGMRWPLTDNPAVSAASLQNGTREYSARMDTPGAHLLLPLSPDYLLYHRVGYPLKEQYTVAHPLLAQQMRGDLIDAAYRSIYSRFEDPEIKSYRPRKVDAEAAMNERNDWLRFGAEQTRAERFEPRENA